MLACRMGESKKRLIILLPILVESIAIAHPERIKFKDLTNEDGLHKYRVKAETLVSFLDRKNSVNRRLEHFAEIKEGNQHKPQSVEHEAAGTDRLFYPGIYLHPAAHLLEQGFGNVAEVAYEGGFNSLSYFARVFLKQFGNRPSHYLNR